MSRFHDFPHVPGLDPTDIFCSAGNPIFPLEQLFHQHCIHPVLDQQLTRPQFITIRDRQDSSFHRLIQY